MKQEYRQRIVDDLLKKKLKPSIPPDLDYNFNTDRDCGTALTLLLSIESLIEMPPKKHLNLFIGGIIHQ